jgi:hypothetical protein
MSDKHTEELTFRSNGVTLNGLTDFFSSVEDGNENYERNYLPEGYDEWKREVYNNLEDVDTVTISVEFE